MNKLDYVKTPKPYPEATVFSPSQFAKFINKPYVWYREQVLGESGFTGNTASVIGTIVHYIAEMVATDQEVDKVEINRYIDSKEPSDDYDPDIVREAYPEMAKVLINEYVLENVDNYLATELQLHTKIRDDYYVGGTIDVVEGSKDDALVNDYKTYSGKTKPKVIPNDYKYQLLIYAAILIGNGYNVTRIRLTYISRAIVGEFSEKTGKQFKSYPSELTVLTEVLTDDDMNFIYSMLNLCVDSLEVTKKHPELTHVIWHDARLKV